MDLLGDIAIMYTLKNYINIVDYRIKLQNDSKFTFKLIGSPKYYYAAFNSLLMIAMLSPDTERQDIQYLYEADDVKGLLKQLTQ